MSYKVITIKTFEKQVKRLTKKYFSLKNELLELIENLKGNPEQGVPIGSNCYKIRLAITSKGKGKSGGARVIINIVVSNQTVYLLNIYDKLEKENLTSKELLELLKDIPQ